MPRRSYQEIADDFEQDVRILLKNSGFENVAGGRNFILGGNQVDACGGCDGILLVIECKTSQRVGSRLRDHIRKFRGQIDSIRTAVRKSDPYRKYQKVVFIIATDFEINKRDRKIAGRKIQLWDRAFTDYYRQLAPKLGCYAGFNILGEMGQKPPHTQEECIPCIRHKVRGVNLFLFVARPQNILRWAYVARREVGKEFYYQRFVESGKVSGIATYIKKQTGYFPNAAVLAFNKRPKFRRLNGVATKLPDWARGEMEFGLLFFPPTYRSCLIIDGQHRMYGTARVEKPALMMPMVALERAAIEEQATLFLDINKNQKQVPSDLVWDLEGEMRPHGEDGVISLIVKSLNTRGVLRDRIYVPEQGRKRPHQLKLSGLCTAISNQKLAGAVLKTQIGNPLFSSDHGKRVKRVVKSLNGALSVMNRAFDSKQRDGFWLQNSGMAVFLALVGKILSRLKRAPTEKDYRKFFRALKGHFTHYRSADRMKSLRQRCNSEGGREEVVTEFVRVISQELGDALFGDGLPEDKFEKRIKKVERTLATTVAKELSAIDPHWLDQRVAGDIRNRANDRRQKQHDQQIPIEDFFTFGEVAAVIKTSQNWERLKAILAKKQGFSSLGQFEAAAQTINDLRGRTAHGRGKFSEADQSLLEGYLSKFEMVLGIEPEDL